MNDTDARETEREKKHEVFGTGDETVVRHPQTGQLFGPGGFSIYDYCPYCGESSDSEGHRVDESIDEVFCDYTTMSTYRYCPSCGKRVDGAR